MFRRLRYDIQSIKRRDPAARSSVERIFIVFWVACSDVVSRCALVL